MDNKAPDGEEIREEVEETGKEVEETGEEVKEIGKEVEEIGVEVDVKETPVSTPVMVYSTRSDICSLHFGCCVSL